MPITETELRLIAAAANMGEGNRPKRDRERRPPPSLALARMEYRRALEIQPRNATAREALAELEAAANGEAAGA